MIHECPQESFTVLICDCAKSQSKSAVGTGAMAPTGYTPTFLRERATAINALAGGVRAEIVEFNSHCSVPGSEDACALVIRGTARATADASLKHVAKEISYDRFAFLQGSVKNAHSRHLVFVGQEARRADASTGVHTVLPWSEVPALSTAKDTVLNEYLGDPAHVDSACLLHYQDINKCGIGWHGDGERRRTILYRVGKNSARRPIHLQWYQQGMPVSEPMSIILGHGDFFIPSAKAVGTDWKLRKVPTLRHATGFLSQGAAPKVTARAAKRQREAADAKPSTTTAHPFGTPVFEEWDEERDGPEPFGCMAAGWGHRSLASYPSSPKRSKK